MARTRHLPELPPTNRINLSPNCLVPYICRCAGTAIHYLDPPAEHGASLGLALFAGAVLARTKRFRLHAWCQSAVVLINFAIIALLMVPSFHANASPKVPAKLGKTYYSLATAHAALGVLPARRAWPLLLPVCLLAWLSPPSPFMSCLGTRKHASIARSRPSISPGCRAFNIPVARNPTVLANRGSICPYCKSLIVSASSFVTSSGVLSGRATYSAASPLLVGPLALPQRCPNSAALSGFAWK